MEKDSIILEKVHKYELELLNEFKLFCESHDLKYSLGYGSLLGAIRHKGFIPWDDDIDVLMPREDFSKLVGLFENDDKTNIALQTNFSDENYTDGNARLVLKNTVYLNEENVDLHYKYQGVWIDIWPLDFFTDLKKAKKRKKTINYLTALLRIKVLKFKAIPTFKRKFIKTLMIPFSKKFLLNNRDNRYVKNLGKKHLVNFNGVYSFEKEIFPASLFDDLIVTRFENISVNIPKDYAQILEQLYGDYMTPPKTKKIYHKPIKVEL